MELIACWVERDRGSAGIIYRMWRISLRCGSSI